MKFVCFDLEGPLSPQDNAYELMKCIPNGDRIFEIISRYDDLLTLKGKRGYEPGDTLALIVPFLIYHDISEADMREASDRATLVDGARTLVAKLIDHGWWVGDITTCYEQYGYPITQRIGIYPQNVACTRFPLDQLRKAFRKEDLSEVKQLEKDILAMRPLENDEYIKRRLDSFYWGKTANATVRAAVKKVKPLGGWRKVDVLSIFAEINQLTMDKIVVVGDSITDFKMLDTVNKAGGLAIAFNANEYALKYATMSLASVRLDDLWVVLEAWEKGGREDVERVVKESEKAGGTRNRGWLHWLDGTKDITTALEIHKRIRRLVREGAAKLG
jgi:energy-converting hydrogenase A subunit R